MDSHKLMIFSWEQCKLGDLGSIGMNKRIFKEQTSEVGEIPFYKIGTFGDSPDAFISRELFEEYKFKYPYPNIGDILISASGSIGRTVEYKGYDEYFQDSNIVWLRHQGRIDNSFLKQFYMIVKWTGLEGSTIKRLYNKNILDTTINLPSLLEQKKVGNFFKQLDEAITLHQRKLVQLKTLKQAYLQQLFPSDGEYVPKVRFANFNQDWELCKVATMAKKTYGGGTPKTSVKEYWQGDLPWIQSSDLIVDNLKHVMPTKFITQEAISKSATKAIPKNSIAIVTRVGVGKLALIPYSYATSQDFLSLSLLNVDSYFGVYSLYKLLQNEINYIQGTSIKGITKGDLLEKSIKIPMDTVEQTGIGIFFNQLDEAITLHQHKLESLNKLKQAYLQKMFI